MSSRFLVDSLMAQGHWEHKGQFEMFHFRWAKITNLFASTVDEVRRAKLVGDPRRSASLRRWQRLLAGEVQWPGFPVLWSFRRLPLRIRPGWPERGCLAGLELRR